MDAPFVIIGGDAAGMSAASKAKRVDPELDVIVFERDDWVSYAACGMPYYLKGSVDSLDDLVSITPEEFRNERDIDVRLHNEVIDIDPQERTITVDCDVDRYNQRYGSLLIATGAKAIEPPFEGMALDGVFTLRDMDEAERIASYLDGHDLNTGVVVGGGYIGVEMAEALSGRDIDVTMFEMESHILQPFGEQTAQEVEEHLDRQGVELNLETAVERFTGEGQVESVEFNGDSVAADIVIVGVGVKPNVEIARSAGIEIGETGAIETDSFGRTNESDIFAAGDCAEARNVITGEADYVPLALTANRAGRAIGSTVAGRPEATGGTAGTAIVKAFDLGVARTGILDENRARNAGFDPVSVTIEARSRPGYYPGGTTLTVTLSGDGTSGRLLGASVVGREGAKRIDTVATALHAEMTVGDLERSDLAYAPPFSPVWDPILTAAKVLAGKIHDQ